MSFTDNDKCLLLNLKDELHVFLLNKAVNFSKAQESIRRELEESLAFFKRQDLLIKESKTLEASEEAVKESCERIKHVRTLRISTLYHKNLVLLCESWATKALTLHSVFGKPYLTQEVLASEQIIQKLENEVKKSRSPSLTTEAVLPSWKKLLKDLKIASKSCATLQEFENLRERVKTYEHELICLRHKNEYRDAIYMELYKTATRLVETNDPDVRLLSEKYSFYRELNEYENALRKKISDLETKITSTKVEVKEVFVRRGGPKHCPGIGSGAHECPTKTKFYPAFDKIERCRLCHEAVMIQNGGKIQTKKTRQGSPRVGQKEPMKVRLVVK
jgi:hypothetical protein